MEYVIKIEVNRMKIITVNLPVNYINTIKTLVGDSGLYPSRSELIRVAVRDFLIKELKIAKNFPKGNIFSPHNSEEMMLSKEEESSFVNVPTDIKVGNTVVRDFKRYRIIDRSEKLMNQE
jgi:Arc/MetJ-type ribon-helix-helix transcriptional regulator